MNLDAERFWNITPREAKREMAAAIHHQIDLKNRNAWLAWHVAVLGRTKKIPKLEDLMIDNGNKSKSRPPEPWEISYAKMTAWAMRHKRKN